MAKAKTPPAADSSAGSAAYALAVQHKPEIAPRLPTGTLESLADDLTTLGAAPEPPAVPPTVAPPPAAPPPSLAEALAAVVTLLTAFHEAIVGAKAKPAVRKAYGVSGKTPTKNVKAVLADAQKLAAQAQANPPEALALGILPGDITLLQTAIDDLVAAQAAAEGPTTKTGASGKAKRAASMRMHEAVARIAGVGALAFATNQAVRAQFEALLEKRSG